ncbi:MAG: peptidoglycan DD-metalloendopeptidase family protein [Ruminococcus sp.]|nr:peptidoglycan DD-metalloendopeptidase family protein [Ruminococcus sp.]
MNIFRKLTDLLARAGLTAVKFFAALILAVCSVIRFVLLEILNIFKALLRALKFVAGVISESFRDRVKLSNKLTKDIRNARKESPAAAAKAVARFIGSFFFGEDGVFYTAFNYIAPVLAVFFLISVIRYGSGFEYGLAVELNGKQLGIISSESEFESAEHEVEQRISYAGDQEKFSLDVNPKFTLKIISDSDKYISSSELANIMLEASDEELTTAYGIYIDGELIGAVRDKEAVQDALADELFNYEVDGTVRDVSYVNKIEYTEGIYLVDGLMPERSAISLLTSSRKKRGAYVTQDGDSPAKICQKYNMTLEDFAALNPKVSDNLKSGKIVNVYETERYLPIQYIREMESLSFIDYETIEVETSMLNLGVRSMLVKGEKGEKMSKIEVTYVDGIENSRRVISSRTVKQPVVEEIGIGTYTAMPDDPQTVYFGSPLMGTGTFGWPLAGGWVSDSFISNRMHKGMDIAAAEGTEIYAAREGMVVSAGWNDGGYGNVVMIDHLDGYQTVYAHMCLAIAQEGDYVEKGQLIGLVGNTGDSYGAHCHFEIRYNGIHCDPKDYLNTTEMGQEEDKKSEKDKKKTS